MPNKSGERVKVEGVLNEDGFLEVEVKGEMLLYHHIVWYLRKGDWPTKEIYHIDGNKQNNRIENLAERE